jgi:hypothetical protein
MDILLPRIFPLIIYHPAILRYITAAADEAMSHKLVRKNRDVPWFMLLAHVFSPLRLDSINGVHHAGFIEHPEHSEFFPLVSFSG